MLGGKRYMRVYSKVHTKYSPLCGKFLSRAGASGKEGRQSKGSLPSAPDIRPPIGTVKVVAVARNKGSGVIAAVARSDAGEYLGSSVVFVERISDPEVLEAMAVREGLNWL
jgi:hypothetical protein